MATSPNYFLITGSTAAEVEARLGLHGIDTPYGVLVERSQPDHILNPIRCTCGRDAIIHQLNCPAAGIT